MASTKISQFFYKFPADGPAPEVIVTKPSPEQQTHPHSHVHALSLRPDNATLVHVLVHRESEEYKDDDEEEDECATSIGHGSANGSGSGSSSSNGNGHEKPKPPQIRITTGSSESQMDSCLIPTVQIMVDSPKEPPRGDFSMDSGYPNLDAPIDVNVQGDTSQVFYDYNPDNTNEIVVVAAEPEQPETQPQADATTAAIDQQR